MLTPESLGQDYFRGEGEAPPEAPPASTAPSSGIPLALALGLLYMAWVAGRASGARAKAPVPTLGGMVTSYVGLRGLDAVLGRFAR